MEPILFNEEEENYDPKTHQLYKEAVEMRDSKPQKEKLSKLQIQLTKDDIKK